MPPLKPAACQHTSGSVGCGSEPQTIAHSSPDRGTGQRPRNRTCESWFRRYCLSLRTDVTTRNFELRSLDAETDFLKRAISSNTEINKILSQPASTVPLIPESSGAEQFRVRSGGAGLCKIKTFLQRKSLHSFDLIKMRKIQGEQLLKLHPPLKLCRGVMDLDSNFCHS